MCEVDKDIAVVRTTGRQDPAEKLSHLSVSIYKLPPD